MPSYLVLPVIELFFYPTHRRFIYVTIVLFFFQCSKEPELPFTVEEDNWLRLQLSKYSEAFATVAPDEDFIDEYFKFSCDVPLSKNFGYKGYSVFRYEQFPFSTIRNAFDDGSISQDYFYLTLVVSHL